MTNSAEVARRLGLLARAETSDLLKLVETAGLDPSNDFRSANLNGVDVRGQDLSDFDFTDASFHGALIAGARFNHTVSALQLSEARDAPSLVLEGRGTNHNRARAVPELVAVDAWLGPSQAAPGRTDLHVDVSFGVARLGGEADSAVRFRLALRRAEIVVRVPEAEPVKIDRANIWRGNDSFTEGEVSIAKAVVSGTKAGVSKRARVGRVETDLSILAGSEQSSKVAVVNLVAYPQVHFSSRDDGAYHWLIGGLEGASLAGRAWNSSEHALLQVIDTRKNPRVGLPPALTLEIQCRREDLVISDIVLRDNNLWDRLIQRRGARNRIAAAEAYIRDLLLRSGLMSGNLEDRYSMVTLARMVVSEEG